MTTLVQGIWSTVFLQPEEVIKHQGDNNVNADDTPFLNSRQVAIFLVLSNCMLNLYRSKDDGPVFHPFGHRARCHRAGLEAWAAERRIAPTSIDDDYRHICPHAGGGGTGPVADPSHEMEALETNEEDASHG